METSILLAQIIAPIMLIVGIGILINLEHYRQLVANFGARPFQIYLSGTMDLLIGILVVCFHNVWEWRWPVLASSFTMERLRRMIRGQHHRVEATKLDAYAAHAGWLEDHRRESNGQLADRLIRSALQAPVSRTWNGYWQRAA